MPTIPITPLIAHVLLCQGGTLSSASSTYPLSLFYHTRQCCQSLAKHVTSRIPMPPVRIFLCQPPNIGRYISEVCCCHSNFFPCIYCCLCLSHSGVPSFLRLQLWNPSHNASTPSWFSPKRHLYSQTSLLLSSKISTAAVSTFPVSLSPLSLFSHISDAVFIC